MLEPLAQHLGSPLSRQGVEVLGDLADQLELEGRPADTHAGQHVVSGVRDLLQVNSLEEGKDALDM